MSASEDDCWDRIRQELVLDQLSPKARARVREAFDQARRAFDFTTHSEDAFTEDHRIFLDRRISDIKTYNPYATDLSLADYVRNIFIDEYRTSLSNFVDCQQGDFIVYNDTVAYQLDFEIKMPFSIVVDRGGDYLKIAPAAS